MFVLHVFDTHQSRSSARTIDYKTHHGGFYLVRLLSSKMVTSILIGVGQRTSFVSTDSFRNQLESAGT